MGVSGRQLMAVMAVMGAAQLAGGFSRVPVGIEAQVPVQCSVGFAATRPQFDAEGMALLGHTLERCNSGSGYRLYAVASGDIGSASLLVDGRAVALTAGRQVLLVDEDGAGTVSRSLAYLTGPSSGGGSLDLVLVPK